MNKVEKIIEELQQIDLLAIKSKYYSQPIPSTIDDRIDRMLDILINLNKNEWLDFLKKLGNEAIIFSVFSERMSSLSIRKNNINLAKKALQALVISSYIDDEREVLLVLSLVHNSIIKLGIVPSSIFKEISSLLGREVFLQQYLSRNDREKSIEVMGYIESEDDDGFLYKRTW